MATGLGDLRIGVFQSDLLLGADKLEPDDRRRYERFFLELVRQRGFPLHTASLWNALFFGWDLELKGYLGRGLRATLARSGPAIPVGSIVEINAGTRIVLAEVVYKEGRDAGIDEWACADPAISGTRVRLGRSHTDEYVREGLVLDFDAFSTINDALRFDRAARRGWLTGDRHLEVEAHYGSTDAGPDDLTLFARRAFEAYGDGLFSDLLRDDGVGVGPDERWELLLSSLQAVDEIATNATGLRPFGGYHIDVESYRRNLHDEGGLYGASAFRYAVRSAVVPRERSAATYTGVGRLIREWFSRGEGTEADEQELLNGPGYGRLVLETNLAIAETVGDKGRVDGGYVRLDDDYQGGGVWRSVFADGGAPPEAAWHPLVPLGLGYASTLTDLGAPVSPFDAAGEPIVEASDRSWTVTLRMIDLEHGDVAIPAPLIAKMASGEAQVIVDFSDGLNTKWRRLRPIDRDRRLIRQVRFGLDAFPGVVLRCAASGMLVSIRATPLAVPQAVEGRPQPLRLLYNERIFKHQIGFERLDTPPVRAARSLTSQIAEVFRARGREIEGGGRALSPAEIVTAILGPGFARAASLPIVLALQAGEFSYRGGEYIWYPRVTRRTSARDRVRIADHRASSAGDRLRRSLKPRTVPMRIRHLHHGWRPSDGKIAGYADALRRYHRVGQLPDALPTGCTWVEPYTLGAWLDENEGAVTI